jgi:hypothetical protein
VVWIVCFCCDEFCCEFRYCTLTGWSLTVWLIIAQGQLQGNQPTFQSWFVNRSVSRAIEADIQVWRRGLEMENDEAQTYYGTSWRWRSTTWGSCAR